MRSTQLPDVCPADHIQYRARRLDYSSSRIDALSKEVAFERRTLINLASYVNRCQVREYQSGPLGVRQQETPRICGEVDASMASLSSWYCEDDDRYIPRPQEQIVEEWSRDRGGWLFERECSSDRSSHGNLVLGYCVDGVDTGGYWGDASNLLDDYSEAADSTSIW